MLVSSTHQQVLYTVGLHTYTHMYVLAHLLKGEFIFVFYLCLIYLSKLKHISSFLSISHYCWFNKLDEYLSNFKNNNDILTIIKMNIVLPKFK